MSPTDKKKTDYRIENRRIIKRLDRYKMLATKFQKELTQAEERVKVLVEALTTCIYFRNSAEQVARAALDKMSEMKGVPK